MQNVTDLTVPTFSTEERAKLADPSPVQLEVSIIMEDGRDQHREDAMTLLSNAEKHDIFNAWTAARLHKGHQLPPHVFLLDDEEAHKAHDSERHGIQAFRDGMDILISAKRNTAAVTVWVTYTGKASDGFPVNLRFQSKIERVSRRRQFLHVGNRKQIRDWTGTH
jgi:hypothetical protein